MVKVISIIAGLLILSVITLFHELGHLLLAKKNGIAVPEFFVGFGPKLFSFTKNGTEYSFRPIPLGGACRMLGEDGDYTAENAFPSKSVGARFATVFAGPFFNFILAFVLSVIVIGIIGYDPCTVLRVDENGPAYEAGLRTGDVITSFDGQKITLSRELMTYLSFEDITAEPIQIKYERDGEVFSAVLTPTAIEAIQIGFTYTPDNNPLQISAIAKGGALEEAGVHAGDIITGINGIAINSGKEFYEYVQVNPLTEETVDVTIRRNSVEKTLTLKPRHVINYSIGFDYNNNGRIKTTPLKVIRYSFSEVKYWIVNTVKTLGKLLTGSIGTETLGGPVRVVSEVETTVKASQSDGTLYVVLNLLNWGILLSANIGVMNLLPIPALDGGRLVFIILEAIRRKPIPPEKEGIVHAIGVILLLILMVFIFFNDIKNVFFR